MCHHPVCTCVHGSVCIYMGVCVVTSNIDPFCDETPSHQPLHHHSVGGGRKEVGCVCVCERNRSYVYVYTVVEYIRLSIESRS